MNKNLAEALEAYFALWLESILSDKAGHKDSYSNADEMQQAFLEDLDENVISQFADCQDWEEIFADLIEEEEYMNDSVKDDEILVHETKKEEVEPLSVEPKLKSLPPFKKSQVAVRLPPSLFSKFKKYVQETGMSQTDVVVSALAKYLDSDEGVPMIQRLSELEERVSVLESKS
jgi:hypothetical protein